jgi:hypothetical protein
VVGNATYRILSNNEDICVSATLQLGYIEEDETTEIGTPLTNVNDVKGNDGRVNTKVVRIDDWMGMYIGHLCFMGKRWGKKDVLIKHLVVIW